MRIEKKTWPESFNAILRGVKTFDVRLADWKCSVGDTLVLREYDPGAKQYTGRVLEKKITYILRTKDQPYFSEEEVKKHGFQILGFS